MSTFETRKRRRSSLSFEETSKASISRSRSRSRERNKNGNSNTRRRSDDDGNLSDVSGILDPSTSPPNSNGHAFNAQPARRTNEISEDDTLESRFQLHNKVYGGTYGEVWRGTDLVTSDCVALKFIKISHRTSRSGFPITALREIQILNKLKQHDNIISMHGVVTSASNIRKIAMVLQFAEHDLKTLLDLGTDYTASEIKCLLKQLLAGVSFMHSKFIMHRDLKPNNLLLKSDGTLKICDFGQSRTFSEPLSDKQLYTPQCTTLYYRAPEMLLDLRQYNGGVDDWAVGCIAVELFTKRPMFKIDASKFSNGMLDGELALLNEMIQTLGSPNDEHGGNYWLAFADKYKLCRLCKSGKMVKNLYPKRHHQRNNRRAKQQPMNTLPVVLRNTGLSSKGYAFITSLLTYDPMQRMTSTNASNHEWFQENPMPIDKAILPTHPPTNTETRDNVMKRNKEKKHKAVGFMQF